MASSRQAMAVRHGPITEMTRRPWHNYAIMEEEKQNRKDKKARAYGAGTMEHQRAAFTTIGASQFASQSPCYKLHSRINSCSDLAELA